MTIYFFNKQKAQEEATQKAIDKILRLKQNNQLTKEGLKNVINSLKEKHQKLPFYLFRKKWVSNEVIQQIEDELTTSHWD